MSESSQLNGSCSCTDVEVIIPNQTIIKEVEVGVAGIAGAGFSDNTKFHTTIDEAKNAPITSMIRVDDSEGEPCLISKVNYTDWKGYSSNTLDITYNTDDSVNTVLRKFTYEAKSYIYEIKLNWNASGDIVSKDVLQALSV